MRAIRIIGFVLGLLIAVAIASADVNVLDCSTAPLLVNGTAVNGTTADGQANVSDYNCVGWDESGLEKVYRITVAEPGAFTVSLSNLTDNLDLLLLSACGEESCVAYGDYSLSYTTPSAGTWYLCVDGRNGATGSYTLLLCVTLNAPTLTEPADSANVCSGVSRSFAWGAVANAVSYTIQWDDNSAFTSPQQQTLSAASLNQTLTGSGLWYWRVRANNAGTCTAGAWSAVRAMALTPSPGQPSLLGPASGAALCSGAAQTYSWNSVVWATGYTIQWDDNSGFNSPEEETISATSISHALTGAGTWYWRIRSNNACTSGSWSPTRSLTLTPAPLIATQISPADGATVCSGLAQAYTWNAVSYATTYTVQWDTDSSFGSPDEQTVATASANRTITGAGAWYWRVRANNACAQSPWSAARTIALTPTPGAPTQNGPANGIILCSGVPQDYTWSAGTYAATYTIQWDDNSAFSSPVEQTVTGTSVAHAITSAVTWYWRVRSNNSCGGSTWSATRTVNLTLPPIQAALAGPPDGTTVCSGVAQVFTWYTAAYATSYSIQWDDDSLFNLPGELTITGTSVTSTLSGGGTWYWRVRSNNGCSAAAWSASRTIALTPSPAQPALSSPADGIQLTTGLTQVYSWSSVPAATTYTVQWDDNPAFSSPVEHATGGTSYSQALTGLGPWYWRVRGSNTCGTGAWSASRTVNLIGNLVTPNLVVWLQPDSLRLAWSTVPGATSYQVLAASQWEGPYSLLVTQPDTTHGMIASPQIERFYRVIAQSP